MLQAFFISLFFTFISEIADKTQLVILGISIKYKAPLQIFIGAFLALALSIGLNVFVGTKIAGKLPAKSIKIATSSLFILFGLISLFA